MSTVTATHALVRDALLAAGVYAVDFPADDLPVDPETGLVGQAAVLRETSTAFAALIGWVMLGEKVGPVRTALMLLIASGAVLVQVGAVH